MWAPGSFLAMLAVVVTATSAFHMLVVFVVSKIVASGYSMTSPACTLSCVLVATLMGLRQNFYESKLVTPIPLFRGFLKIPFKVLRLLKGHL